MPAVALYIAHLSQRGSVPGLNGHEPTVAAGFCDPVGASTQKCDREPGAQEEEVRRRGAQKIKGRAAQPRCSCDNQRNAG